MLTKAISIALGVALIALAALGFLYRAEVRAGATTRTELKASNTALEGVAKQRKKDSATLAAWQAERASTGRKLADAQQALSQALQGEKAWSEVSVPTTVQQALLRDSERSKHEEN